MSFLCGKNILNYFWFSIAIIWFYKDKIMKKSLLFIVVILLTGCNSLRCEFTHPDNMSPALLEYCKAEASSSDVYVSK